MIAAGCMLAAAELCAQELPDSLKQGGQSPLPEILIGFEPADAAAAVQDTLLHFDHDLTTALARNPGSFQYGFGAFGWPAGWSYLGASPNNVALYWHGIPFDDPLTGRPRFDLLPTALLQTPAVAIGTRARPSAVLTRLRAFEAARPLTELHYQAGDNGLQRVTALHVQELRRQLWGQPGVFQGLFGYAGAAAEGEYPGSRLRRMRQLLLRSRYQQRDWSLELTYLHNQRRLGAHGGVVPAGNYDAIYNRLIATTRGANAVRRQVRNDASVTLRMRSFESPISLQVWHTSGRLRYMYPAKDTTEMVYSRWGLRMRQPLTWGSHRLRLLAEGDVQQGEVHLHTAVRDSVDLGVFTLASEAGFTVADGKITGGATVMAQYRRRIYASASAVGLAPRRMDTQGFGRTVGTLENAPSGRTNQVRLGARVAWGVLDADAFGFVAQERAVTDYYGQRSDSMAVRVYAGAMRLLGLAFDVGIRRTAARGFYGHMQGLLVTTAGAVPAARMQAVPRYSGQGRVGLRYRLFTGDLRLDVSVRARAWSAMTSRTLHAPTGLLVLPEDPSLYPAAGRLPASAAIDAVAEAGVRTAVLFAAYENVASGTQLMAGNQVVPVYPLPAVRLRFGVFWPIEN